jgi:shikimate kinase
MNIILFGYRGSGKTTVGKLLAEELWKTLADTDEEIRRRFAGATIAEIWAKQGVAAFRQAEVEVTRELCARKDLVIALGGGTLMQPEARLAVQQAPEAVRIYLHCTAEELARRLAQDSATVHARPNLTALGGGIEEIKTVLAQREPVYRSVADKVFDVTHVQPKQAVRFLIAQCL